jgi:hypothetical protein
MRQPEGRATVRTTTVDQQITKLVGQASGLSVSAIGYL